MIVQQTNPEVSPFFELSRMIASAWIPQTIYAAAALGIADALAEGPKLSGQLAAGVGAHPDSLHRLLRALVALQICARTDSGAFELTPLGACLRSDAPGSLRSWALFIGSEMYWRSWEHLVTSVRTGDHALELPDRMSTFEFIAAHPNDFSLFYQAMADLTSRAATAVVNAYDLSDIHTIVDVGGGHGALITTILEVHPNMSGVVFDLPHSRDGAVRTFQQKRVAARCQFVAGSFFETVPTGADAYLLKSVLHDWGDEQSLVILRNCRAAMSASARLLIIEMIMSEHVRPSPLDAMIVGTDLRLLATMEGRERTEREYRDLLDSADLRIARIVPTASAFSVIEALPV